MKNIQCMQYCFVIGEKDVVLYYWVVVGDLCEIMEIVGGIVEYFQVFVVFGQGVDQGEGQQVR